MEHIGGHRRRRSLTAALLASTVLSGGAYAQSAPPSNTGLEEIVVTAEKRSEDLQTVPISVQALNTTKIEQLNITDFEDYVKFLPSVTYQSVEPGQTNIYMRGVASGGDGNHSGSQPSVGVYLDEIPVTTIEGALDIHIYDVARIEALSGPQGTLYGASSQAGTLRIISNAPDPSGFSGSYDLEINEVDHGAVGNVAEGYVNIPLADNAAIRIVGWEEYDAGYIDNVYGTRTYPTSGITQNNRSVAQNNYNDATTAGGRMALKINLDDSWTVTPSIIGQDQWSYGVTAYDPSVGDLKVTHFFPESNHDSWVQTGLTVQGKIGNFDLTYAGGYFVRTIDEQSDYSDYSYFYDTLFGYGHYFTDNAGNLINPAQYIRGHDYFTKQSHELRLSSPSTDRLRVTGGLFFERQTHDIEQAYKIDNLATASSVTGWPDTFWLTEQTRIDRDYAIFAETSYDITPQWTLTAGARGFRSDNSLFGFYGFGLTNPYGSSTGEQSCFTPFTPFHGAPCVNLNKEVTENNATYKGNLTYNIEDGKIVYVTLSSGYRPGGVNRNGNFPPYTSDFLYNYEFGWKTTWLDNTLRWNGALYYDQWDNFQYSYLGPNGLTIIANAGEAAVKGLETDLTWRATQQLTISGSLSLTDAALTQPFCGQLDANGQQVSPCPAGVPQGPSGTQLPVTPYVKGNVTARYDFEVGANSDGFVQGSMVYTGGSWSDLSPSERDILGRQPSYFEFDFSAGMGWGDTTAEIFIKNAFDERGQVYRYAECATAVCGTEPYINAIRPMTVGFKFGQKF